MRLAALLRGGRVPRAQELRLQAPEFMRHTLVSHTEFELNNNIFYLNIMREDRSVDTSETGMLWNRLASKKRGPP